MHLPEHVAMTTARDIVAALRAKYPAPGFAVFSEVGNATGFGTSRHADAVVCSLYPSAGLWMGGFEIKVARGDWLKELKQPEKSHAIAQHCDYWWVVAPDLKTVNPDEAPPHWGVMVMHGSSLRVARRRNRAAQLRDGALPRRRQVG
jgi:hypothetical protein